MPGKSDGQGDEYSEYWNPIEDSMTMAPPFRYNTPRSIMPKGTLFPNLGEAHQAITSRLASRPTTGNHISDSSLRSSSSTDYFVVNVSGPTNSAQSLSSVRHMEPAKPSLPERQRCLTASRPSTSRSTGWANTPSEPSPIVSGFESSSAGNSVGNNLNNGAREGNRGNLEPSETSNSVGDIYDQYHTSPTATQGSRAVDGAAPSNTHLYHSEADLTSSHPRSPDIGRVKTSIGPGNTLWQRYHLGDESHQLPLPEPSRTRGHTTNLPRGSFNVVQNFSRPALSIHSVSTLQEPMSAPANLSQASSFEESLPNLETRNSSELVHSNTGPANSDFVIYGRLPPQSDDESLKDRICQGGDVSHGGMSNGVSTDSDEDPFKYDRGSFTVFLQPSREREVSAALRFVSADSTASASGIFQDSLSLEPDTPRVAQSTNNPFVNGLQSYHAATIDYDWEDGDLPREVKISVRSPPAPPNSPVQRTFGLSDYIEGLGGGRRRKDINTLVSDGADWETVATSLGQFDSNRALASSTGYSESQLVKVTGSSIADYSDTSSIHVPQFDAFSSSTERILQHPDSEHMHNTHYPRSLNNTRRPVFLPKPRIHRVNGYLHDPLRKLTDTTTGSSANSARSALVEKLSASIRSRKERKLAQRRDQSFGQQWSRSRFESLESLSSTYSEQPEEEDNTPIASSPDQNGITPIPRQENHVGLTVTGGEIGQQHVRNSSKELLASPIPREPTAAHIKNRHATLSAQSPRDFESPTLFTFPLISLQEAARRKAIGAQNGDDCTVTTRKNCSIDASRATTQRTTPPTPQITKPIPAHASRPTSASILGISRTHRGYSDYSQDHIVLGHDRGISNVTSYKSGTPLVPGHSALSRFFRPPFEPVTSSDASFLGPGNQSVFETPPCLIARDERNTARAVNLTMSNARKTMTADLHTIAVMESSATAGASGGDRGNPLAFFPSTAIDDADADADAAAYLSWEARKRRQAYYYAMCSLCVVPFFALLVYRGTFDSALSWYTRGETGSLTRRQRRNTLVMGIVFSGVWLVALTVFVTVMVNRRGG